MKLLFLTFSLGFALLNGGQCAFSAPQHSWFIVTTASSSDPSNPGPEQMVTIRDDGKVRRALKPIIQSNDLRVFSPDDKHWLEVRYDYGFSVASSRKYLVVGDRGESDKDKKPFNDLYVESAEWTPSNNILLSSGFVDWSVGVQIFSYSIISPSTGKEVVDLKSSRESLFKSGKYERDATLSPNNSQLMFVAQSAAFGGIAEDYETDRNDYLVFLDWKAGTASIVAAFKAIGPPHWNPTGTECVFSGSNGWNRNAKTISSNIYVSQSDAVFPLTYSPFKNSSPTWSPDGKRIAWISNRPLKKGDKPDRNRLYVMNADGTNQRVLAPNLVNVTAIQWQKDEPK